LVEEEEVCLKTSQSELKMGGRVGKKKFFVVFPLTLLFLALLNATPPVDGKILIYFFIDRVLDFQS
jgi:hypothetical protein